MAGPPSGSPDGDEAGGGGAERGQRPGAGKDAGRLGAEGQPPGEDLPGGIELEAEEIEPRRPQRRVVGEPGGGPLRRRGERGEHDGGSKKGPDNRWGKRGHRERAFSGEKNVAPKMCPGNKSALKE
jgi:hypothetical protein